MSDFYLDERSFRAALLKRPGLSLARWLAHQERIRRNLERFDAERGAECIRWKEDAIVVYHHPGYNALVRL